MTNIYTIKSLLNSFGSRSNPVIGDKLPDHKITSTSKKIEARMGFQRLLCNPEQTPLRHSFKFVDNTKRIIPVSSRFGRPVNDSQTPLNRSFLNLQPMESCFIDPSFEMKPQTLKTDRSQISSLLSLIEHNFKGRLINKRSQQLSIISLVKLQSIKNVKGIRHILGYPSNGQRTKTNGKSAARLKHVQSKVALLTNLGFK